MSVGTWGLTGEGGLGLLLWASLGLSAAVVALGAHAVLAQARADRLNRLRIACFQRWEASVPLFLFGGAPAPPDVAGLGEAERAFFRLFLQRLRSCLGGPDAEKLTELHALAGLDRTVGERLRHRSPRARALAAMEVWGFSLWSHLPEVAPLLQDPRPYVAFAAARAVARSRDLSHAPGLVRWALSQEQYQRERMMVVLEQCGPDLLPWLAGHLPPAEQQPEGWVFFALLAASHRHHPSLGALTGLLAIDHLELRCAAIKALQALGDPSAYGGVAGFLRHPAAAIRIRATSALPHLGGPAAVPLLLERLGDPVFEVRRHASHGLAALGAPGMAALREVAADAAADRFARDMAVERLQWAEARGHR